MKKQLLIFLLLTIFLNGLLLFLLFSVGEYGAKMHATLSKYSSKEALCFQLTPLEFKAYSHDRNELLIENKLYDIISIEKSDGLLKVICVQDKHEAFFVNLLRSNSSIVESTQNQKIILPLLQYLSLLWLANDHSFQICRSMKAQQIDASPLFRLEYLRELDTPPPQS